MLKVGDKIPEFETVDSEGNPVSHEDILGSTTVLYFYPKDDTPGCTSEGIGFTEKKSEFTSKNAVILGVSKDSQASHHTFCQKYNLTVTLLSDPDNAMIDAYGAWQEKSNYGKKYMGIVRSTVLIDPNGLVHSLWNNVKVEGHVDAVLEKLG